MISLGFFWIEGKLSDYHREVKLLKKTFSETKKLEIKNKILQIKDYIQWVQEIPLNPISQTLANQVWQLKFPVIKTQISSENPLDWLSQEFKDSICNSRIPIYILDNQGKIVYSYNSFEKTENKKLNKKEEALLHQIQIRKTDKGALSLYKAVNRNDSVLEVTGYFNNKILPGFKVASIVSSGYFKNVLQIHILDSISRLRYTTNEYVFVNSIDGKALVTNGKYNITPVDIFVSKNAAWINIFKVQQSAELQPGGVFYTYTWQKLSPLNTSIKTSYFSYVPKWKWIIGTGFYEDDVNSIIDLKRKALYTDMRKNILNVMLYLLISSLLCYFLVILFSKRLKKNIELFRNFFEKAAEENLLIDKSKVSYKEFVDMAEAANRMVEEQKQTGNALKESEAQYRYLFEQNPAPMLVYELNSLNMLAVNDAFINHYGYNKDEILSMQLTDLYPENEKKAIVDLTKKLIGLSYSGEWHQLKKDGTQIAIEAHSHGLSYEGRTARITVINDITERKQVEETLQKSEELYRTIFENTGTATVLIEENTIISLANTEFEKLSKYSKQEIEWKKRWTEFVLKDDLERMQTQHRMRRENQEDALKQYEFRFVTRDGNIRDILLTIDLIPSTRKSVASLLDITERKFMEETLRINESQFSAIFNTISDILYLVAVESNGEFRFLSVNEMFLKATGLKKEQIIDKNILEVIPKSAHELVLGKYREAIENKQTVSWEEISDYPSGKKYGLVKVTPTYNAHGNCTNLVGSVHDITKLRDTENEIRQLNAVLENRVVERTAQLEASNKELESFSYSISHDLRAPLRAIFGFSQILSKRHRASLDDEGRQYMDYIVEASIRMEQLINDLLNYSRLGSKIIGCTSCFTQCYSEKHTFGF